ncbi:hypothetical protein V2J09_001651 [Rumex salicifolius]
MASSGNPNNQGGGGGGGGAVGLFDINNFFKPPANSPAQNPNNLGTSGFPPSPSASYPPPTGPFSYPSHNPPPFFQPPFPTDQRSVSFPSPPIHPAPTAPPQSPNSGARLMALLSAPASAPFPPMQESSGVSELLVPVLPSVQPGHAITAAISQPPPLRMPSSKIPRGRYLTGERVVYDVDVRLQGEVQPQLEVTPITKYVSDPGLILGHQIAVNKTYICYGLKLGAIRVLNINTAWRSLLRGHTQSLGDMEKQRVTDMAFFAEDVHLLASASIDGRIYVWRISEGPDEEDKQQISGNVVIAIHIAGEEGSVHPRVCWHCHKQEILVVAVGEKILRIDTTKVGKGEVFTAEEPLKCPLEKLINGVQFVGKHDGEVTDLSMCQWMTTRLVSASKDGMIKIWDDRKSQPLLVLKPHDGRPVDAAMFMTAPHKPDHITLITAGPQNREVKLWVSSSDEGWLLPSDSESWRCIQTLELKSSAEPRIEEAFFNQVVGLSHAGLVLLANAKKNAIYAIHLEYGDNPAVTRMDYLSEFTVTMPILSFTGTSDVLPHGEHVVQVYCVQTQAIQQYALDLSQCFPPSMDKFGLEKSDSMGSNATEGISNLESSRSKAFDMAMASSEPKNSSPDSTSEIKRAVSSASDLVVLSNALSRDHDSAVLLPGTDHTEDPVGPSSVLSSRLSQKLSDHPVDQAVTDYSVDRQIDNAQTALHNLPYTDSEKRIAPADKNPPVMFKHPTHLITPSEIMATSSSDSTRLVESKSEMEAKIQDVVVNNDTRNIELDVKVVDEACYVKDGSSSSQVEPQISMDRKEKYFCSQASDLGFDMSRECSAVPNEASIIEEAHRGINEAPEQASNYGEEADETMNGISRTSVDIGVSAPSPASISKGKKQKGKGSQASGPGPSSVSAFNSADSLGETGVASGLPSVEAASLQIASMQEMMCQLVAAQKEMNKQMTMMATVPVKEGKRLEAALARSIEKVGKANTDALWARIQEETVKLDKLIRERTQQITTLVTNSFNKELIPVLDKTLKREMAAISTNVARSITPVIEKNISSAINDSFQKCVGEKALNQLERSVNSRIEAIIARQIQAQFQTSGKQALQEGLKSVLEVNVIPAFEMSCKSMFEQVDAAFQKGMSQHITAAQHQMESAHSSLAMTLRESINSASSISQSLSGELAEQRRLLALAAAGAGSTSGLPLPLQINGPLGCLHDKVEQQPFDPKKELSRLISEHKYEEAFTTALQRSDVSIVSWLCSQVELQGLLSSIPLPLSQGVLLSLLQQVACDISKEPSRKLQWMTDVAAAINPSDPMIAVHVRPIFEQVYQILIHHRSLPSTSASELASIRVVMHVINSMLMTCK